MRIKEITAAVILTAVMFLTGCSGDAAPKMCAFSGSCYELSYSDKAWTDASGLKEEIDNAEALDIILRNNSGSDCYVMISNADVGAEGTLTTGNVGAVINSYNRSAGQEFDISGCREMVIDEENAIEVELRDSGSTKMDMVIIWHGTHQIMITFMADSSTYDKLYPDFQQLVGNIDLN